MKFGKLLRVTSAEMNEVEEILQCYKDAKKVLKTWAKPGETQPGELLDTSLREKLFIDTLSVHLKSYNSQWEKREKVCKQRYVEFQRQARPLRRGGRPGCREYSLHSHLHFSARH